MSNQYFRPSTRGELSLSLKDGVSCEVMSQNMNSPSGQLHWKGTWEVRNGQLTLTSCTNVSAKFPPRVGGSSRLKDGKIWVSDTKFLVRSN